MARVETVVGNPSFSRLLGHREPAAVRARAWSKTGRAVAVHSPARRGDRMVCGAIHRSTCIVRRDFSAGPAGDAGYHAADLDRRMGRTRDQHGAGLRLRGTYGK